MYNFPTKSTYTAQELQDSFTEYNFITTPNPGLYYKILLPRDMKPTKLTVDKVKGFDFYTPGLYATVRVGPGFGTLVAYENVKHEMNPSDWLKLILDNAGETIVNEKTYRRKSGEYIDCLTSIEKDGETFLARYALHKRFDMQTGGADFIFVKASCREVHYNDLAMEIWQVINSLELINPSGGYMAELLKTETIDFSSEQINYYYPVSWKVEKKQEPLRAVAYISLKQEFAEDIYSSIQLYFWIPKQGFKDRTIPEDMKNKLDDPGNHKLSPLVKIADYPNPQISELWEAKGVLMNDADVPGAELSFTAGKLGNIRFYFKLISPREQTAYYYWAVNKRTCELLLHSLNNLDLVIRE